MSEEPATQVFVVDDASVIVATVAAILKRSGFESTPFTNPVDALNNAEIKTPDLLISDVVMPRMSGIDLAVQIKERQPQCKVLLFSGQAETVDLLEGARERGHDFYLLSKPIHPTDLLREVRALRSTFRRAVLMSCQERAMKTIQVDEMSRMSLAEVPAPLPGQKQVLIHVAAAGVIATELQWYPTTHREKGESRLHAIPGHEFSGTVVSIGDEVTGFAPGDEVYGMNDWFWEGATAEYCLAVPSSIAIKPKSLTHIEAATVPISALTAWQGLFDRAALRPGERIPVQGGGGAVGLFVVQLDHLHGAYVIATASNENLSLVQTLGADHVIDYKTTKFEDGLAPVDMVFDTVGGSIRERSAAVLKSNGRMISIAADGEVTTDPKVRAAYFIVEPNQEQLKEVARLLDIGQLKTFVKGVVPLKDAGLAYAPAVPGKRSLGKFVVDIG